MPFIKLYQDRIRGIVEGLDRVRFRGTDRMLSNVKGFVQALHVMDVLLKDFGRWAESATRRLREHCARQADLLGIETIYLRSNRDDKEKMAREIAAERGVMPDGSICMLSTVELCVSPTVRGNRETKFLEVSMCPRKCVHVYYYFDHPEVGFGHVRLQSWVPYGITICLNGRHWLEKQLIAEGIGYHKVGNCFPWLEDADKAQSLLDEQLKTDWPGLLNGLVKKAFPGILDLCAPFDPRYYWSADETEFATDVVFKSAEDLDALFPKLLLHAMRVSDCRTTLRYLGRASGQASRGKLPDQVQSDCRTRHEGIRVKHTVNGDSVKMYNKASTVLRVETTINTPRNFKAFRSPNDDETKKPSWQKMCKGVSDLHRRCEVSSQSNKRYLDALSAACVEKTLLEVAKDACNQTTRNGRPVRGLNPWNEQDFNLLTFLAKGEWAINGFRNHAQGVAPVP